MFRLRQPFSSEPPDCDWCPLTHHETIAILLHQSVSDLENGTCGVLVNDFKELGGDHHCQYVTRLYLFGSLVLKSAKSDVGDVISTTSSPAEGRYIEQIRVLSHDSKG